MEVHGACAMLVIFSQPFNPFFLPATLPSALKVSASGIFFESGYSAHANLLLVLRPFASRPSTVPPRHMSLSVLPACVHGRCDVRPVTHHVPPLPVPALRRPHLRSYLGHLASGVCIVCIPVTHPDFLVCISPVPFSVLSSTCAAVSLKPTSVRRKHAQRRLTMFLCCRL